MGATLGIANLFLYCYFGAVATESYEKMAKSVYDCKWPELSIDLQKYILVMIMNAQRPLHYHGFGIAILDLNTFAKLIKAVVTYYTMFKTLTE